MVVYCGSLWWFFWWFVVRKEAKEKMVSPKKHYLVTNGYSILTLDCSEGCGQFWGSLWWFFGWFVVVFG